MTSLFGFISNFIIGAGIFESGFIAFNIMRICGVRLSALSAAAGLSTRRPEVRTSEAFSEPRVSFIQFLSSSASSFDREPDSPAPFGVSESEMPAESMDAKGLLENSPRLPARNVSMGSYINRTSSPREANASRYGPLSIAALSWAAA